MHNKYDRNNDNVLSIDLHRIFQNILQSFKAFCLHLKDSTLQTSITLKELFITVNDKF